MESLIVDILFIQNGKWKYDRSNKKLWHYVKDPEGNVSHAPIGGSYTFPTVTEVHNYIDKLLNES
jgi:hypothetical protein